LDLTSIVIVAGLFLGLVLGDAALFRDPVQLQISVPSRAAEPVVLHKLLATIALLDGNVAEVLAQFCLGNPIPSTLSAAHGVGEANRSFLAIAAGQAQEPRWTTKPPGR
jgi:hypothetical protein